jgi:DNA repair protein RAD16
VDSDDLDGAVSSISLPSSLSH